MKESNVPFFALFFEEQRYLCMIIFCQMSDFFGRCNIISCPIQFLVGGWTLTSCLLKLLTQMKACPYVEYTPTDMAKTVAGGGKELA